MKSNLKQIREKSGLSLQRLSDLCNTNKVNVWEWGNDNANPTLKNAYLLAKVLDKSVYDIWPDTTEIVEESVIVRRIKK